MPNYNWKSLSFIITIIIVALIGFWLYNPFQFYFLNDDFIHIPLSKDGVLFQRKSFRPVCDLSVALDYFIWKKNAWGYHLTNLLLHTADTLLVYFFSKAILRRYLNVNDVYPSLFAALLFYVYPFHSETIFWIIARSASLGAFFFLFSVLFYLRRNDSVIYYVTSVVFFSIGLLTYESVWILPVVVLVFSWLDIQLKRATYKREFFYILLLTIVFVIFIVVKLAVIGEVAGNYEAAAFKQFDIWNILLNALRLFVRSWIPPVNNVITFSGLSVLLLILFLVTGIYFIRKNRMNTLLSNIYALLFICLIVSYLPYLSLGVDTHGSEGERFLYLPSVFICLWVSAIIFNNINQFGYKLIICSCIFLYCLYYLSDSYRNYHSAGKVTKAAIENLKYLEEKKRIIISSLPEECGGALIFRLGFNEAVKWMWEQNSTPDISIISTWSNVSNFPGSYKVVFINSLNPNSGNLSTINYNKATDGILIFSDSALTVIR